MLGLGLGLVSVVQIWIEKRWVVNFSWSAHGLYMGQIIALPAEIPMLADLATHHMAATMNWLFIDLKEGFVGYV